MFVDQDVKTLFLQVAPVLQVITSEVEFELAKQSLQAEMIDCDESSIALAVEDSSEEILLQVCSSINLRYKRHDQGFTVTMPEPEILVIQCESAAELSQVH